MKSPLSEYLPDEDVCTLSTPTVSAESRAQTKPPALGPSAWGFYLLKDTSRRVREAAAADVLGHVPALRAGHSRGST